MTKARLNEGSSGTWTVRDSRSGHFVEVRGANSMKSSQLPLKDSIDLTKPIAEQVLKDRPTKTPTRPAKS
ncbi:hypothetical protein [Rhizobium sp. CAU 1783]